jgi:hypothetical protein
MIIRGIGCFGCDDAHLNEHLFEQFKVQDSPAEAIRALITPPPGWVSKELAVFSFVVVAAAVHCLNCSLSEFDFDEAHLFGHDEST